MRDPEWQFIHPDPPVLPEGQGEGHQPEPQEGDQQREVQEGDLQRGVQEGDQRRGGQTEGEMPEIPEEEPQGPPELQGLPGFQGFLWRRISKVRW